MEEGQTYGIENEKYCLRLVMHSIELRCVTEVENKSVAVIFLEKKKLTGHLRHFHPVEIRQQTSYTVHAHWGRT